MKKVAILGSTGSIGTNTLRVIEEFSDEFEVVALAAGNQVEILAYQIAKFHPRIVSVASPETAGRLSHLLMEKNALAAPEILSGEEGLIAVASEPEAGIVVTATVGSIGFLPTYRALEMGKRVALANKETLVMAGELMTRIAARSGAELLPVDSEHNALHQCLRGERHDEVRRLILTASGGPFRELPLHRFATISREDALKHPTWEMGPKITIDSATLMNKGLEVIEARWLFDFEPGRIDILIHPQSTVHSMVEMIDGSIIAQLGETDMRNPIRYALTYPRRREASNSRLNLTQLGKLEFFEPDKSRFPCMELAYDALREGGSSPAVLNAANEVAVEAFLSERLSFNDIPKVIAETLSKHERGAIPDISAVLDADQWARTWAKSYINRSPKMAVPL